MSTQPPTSISHRLWTHLRSKWRSYLANLVIIAVVFSGVQLWQTRDVPGGQAPDMVFTVVNVDAPLTSATLSEWRARNPDRPLVIHFWAEWCPICRTEENSITRLQQDWPVLTVAMQSGDAASVAKVMRLRNLPWDAALDLKGEVARSYGIPAVPGFLVVDRHGQIRTPTVGYTTELGMRMRLWWVTFTS